MSYNPILHATVLGHSLQTKQARCSWLETMLFQLLCSEDHLKNMSPQQQSQILAQKKNWTIEYNSLMKSIPDIEKSIESLTYDTQETA